MFLDRETCLRPGFCASRSPFSAGEWGPGPGIPIRNTCRGPGAAEIAPDLRGEFAGVGRGRRLLGRVADRTRRRFRLRFGSEGTGGTGKAIVVPEPEPLFADRRRSVWQGLRGRLGRGFRPWAGTGFPQARFPGKSISQARTPSSWGKVSSL